MIWGQWITTIISVDHFSKAHSGSIQIPFFGYYFHILFILKLTFKNVIKFAAFKTNIL